MLDMTHRHPLRLIPSIEANVLVPKGEDYMNAPEEPAPKTVVCIGDSITFGYGLDDPATEAWPALMQERLGDEWYVVNLGVSGTTLIDEGNYPYRRTGNVELAKRLDASVVIIMLGSNDAVDAAWDAEAYEDALIALIDELAQAYSDGARFVLMAPPCVFSFPDQSWGSYGYYDAYGNYITVVNDSDEESSDPDGYDESQFEQDENGNDRDAEEYELYNPILSEDVREIVSRVASEKGALYIDLYAFTEMHPSWFLDGDHLNATGNRAVCDYLMPLLFPDLS